MQSFDKYTLTGSLSVVIWSLGLPCARIVQEEIGAVTFLGLSFFLTGSLSAIFQKRKSKYNAKFKHHPAIYLRWFFFVLHESLILIAVGIVSRGNLPVVILLNYLWPTAIILFSIVISGVKIYRVTLFVVGMVIVIFSLFFELVGGIYVKDIFLGSTDRLAYILAIIGAISWGLYSSISRSYGVVTGGNSPIPFFQLTLALALPISFLPSVQVPWGLSCKGAIILVSLSIAQVFAYNAWNNGVQFGNIVMLSLLADFIPWLSLFGAALVLGVSLNNHTIFSAILLVFGAMTTRYSTVPKKK